MLGNTEQRGFCGPQTLGVAREVLQGGFSRASVCRLGLRPPWWGCGEPVSTRDV